MWYRYSRKKFKYSPVIREKFKPVTEFSLEDSEDKPEEIDINNNPELVPENVSENPESESIPESETLGTEIPSTQIQNPILVDSNDPPVQSDNINRINSIPTPKSPHDGCRCSKRIREKISGGYEWEIDSSMCPDCQAAAQEYNKNVMDALGVNEPVTI